MRNHSGPSGGCQFSLYAILSARWVWELASPQESEAEMQGERRGALLVIGVLVVSAILGGIYGPSVRATSTDVNSLQDSVKSFTHVLSVVQKDYAIPIDTDHAIYSGAIPGMLRVLDPHSSFFDPRAYANLREDQRGRYYGVGMTIVPRDNYTYVLAPMPNSPAYRAGIRPGDVIMAVDGKSTEGLSSSEVADMLKGPKGTVVHINMKRVGYGENLSFTVTRDEIPKHSVDLAFEVHPGIGYIKLSGFNETTDTELAQALKDLDATKLDGIVLDLRGNPGGLLNEAVAVSDMFLDKNQLIVSHHGRSSPERRYYAVRGNRGVTVPLVVIVNGGSASASEIVTGAIQDHDRGLVVGEQSFGKGLVQTVSGLSENTGLALTTARYYTPSGRLIQRDYKDTSLYDYLYSNRDQARANTSHEGQEVKTTDSGRLVYGGGGITPDVKLDPIKLNRFQSILAYKDAFFNFGKYYLGIHNSVSRDFKLDDAALNDFREYLKKDKIPFTEDDLKENHDYLALGIRANLISAIYGRGEGDRIYINNDPWVKSAIDAIPQADELAKKVRRISAQLHPPTD